MAVLKGQIALNIIDRTNFSHKSIQWSKCMEKAVLFEKRTVLTNNFIPFL